jgi:Kef-type K+ transport system membrane component KefB
VLWLAFVCVLAYFAFHLITHIIVATISVFSKLGVNPCLYNIIFGEAVINDAVGIVLFTVFAALDPNETSVGTIIGTIGPYGIALDVLLMKSRLTCK